jgi:hypothetical protein
VLLGLALLLATVSVAAYPRWRHSRRWGFAPCAVAGSLLVVVAVAAAVGRPAGHDPVRTASEPAVAPAPAPAGSNYRDALESARERLSWARPSSFASIMLTTRVD